MSIVENQDVFRQRRGHIAKMHSDLVARRSEIEGLIRQAYDYAGDPDRAKTHAKLAVRAVDEFTTHIEAALNMLKIVEASLHQASIAVQEADKRREQAARRLKI